MDLAYKQELKVGLLVIVALAVFTLGLMWLSGRTLGPSGNVVVPVRFTNVSGIRPGDPVQTSGVRVGRVANVVLQGVGDVMVYLEVNRAQRPHVDAQAMVASADFFGAKFVDYVPGSSPELLRAGQVITGTRAVEVMESAANLTTRASDALAGVQTLLSQQTAEDIHRTLVAVERTLNVVSRIGEGPTISQTQQTLASVQRLAIRLDSTFARPDLGKSLDQMDEVAQGLREMTEGLSSVTNALGSILEKVDRGEGLIGKAVSDSTLHGDLHEVLMSLRKLLDDVRERPGRYVNVKVF
ncbi:MAG TPA: MlaD family protein [Gemmatimonadales bacterium]|jgi:phospholipid/cholesterol/gamma-HCH transport system substrate-binding protein|nr:MlaD family protein [Gemmatimonadales bacterium]